MFRFKLFSFSRSILSNWCTAGTAGMYCWYILARRTGIKCLAQGHKVSDSQSRHKVGKVSVIPHYTQWASKVCD